MIDLSELVNSIESIPAVLETLLSPLDPAALQRRPEPGEWCALEVIGHLVTCEGPAFRDRIRRIVAAEPTIANVDIHELMAGESFETSALGDLIERLRIERAESAAYLRTLSAEDLLRAAEHDKYGLMLAGDFAYEWPYHDQDHIQQILEAVKPRYLDSMSPPMQAAMGAA